MTATRAARVERDTKESKVLVELDLDGSGRAQVSTGVGFYDHMLSSLARHVLDTLQIPTASGLDRDSQRS